ncbi:hypothetical protein K470DRAFT_258715 [Piedraia hortae CBS 480.64]|uniref:Uncharacterized protein n=1 Tax=Piedraia hortae CBS 480.64 TaxID=1314780 RepID=A0A6A7BXA4_9PEZI|nr:hypothetical protein K470DRAFT_258715 [Piedraia hortae CBS 480.64]
MKRGEGTYGSFGLFGCSKENIIKATFLSGMTQGIGAKDQRRYGWDTCEVTRNVDSHSNDRSARQYHRPLPRPPAPYSKTSADQELSTCCLAHGYVEVAVDWRCAMNSKQAAAGKSKINMTIFFAPSLDSRLFARFLLRAFHSIEKVSVHEAVSRHEAKDEGTGVEGSIETRMRGSKQWAMDERTA